MAHLVETMMYVGETPGYGLGNRIPEGKQLNIVEAMTPDGLNWEVELRHILTEDTGSKSIGILDHRAVCRTTDKSFLGIVGSDYVNDKFGEHTITLASTIAREEGPWVISPAWRPTGVRKSDV